MAAFLLPPPCIKELERLCKSFLWKGCTTSAKGSKVAWDSVTTPKLSGGLGLRKLTTSNKVFAQKLIWALFSRSGSLWVAWVKSNLLNTTKSFWSPNSSSKGSWIWRRLMKFKYLAAEFLSCRINSGDQTLFWLDKWTDTGPLINHFAASAPAILGIPLTATVKQAISNGEWKLPRRTNSTCHRLRQLIPQAPPQLISTEKDEYLWKQSSTSSSPTFSSSHTWKLLETPLPPVPWANAVWFSLSIPKHTFTAWVAARHRLPTRDRLLAWGMSIPSQCLLCSIEPESIDHLFVNCCFVKHIWTGTLGVGLSPPQANHQATLHSVMMWSLHQQHTKIDSKIIRLILQAIIYETWKERNSRIHQQQIRTSSIIIKDILASIKNYLMAHSQATPGAGPIQLLERWFGHFHRLPQPTGQAPLP